MLEIYEVDMGEQNLNEITLEEQEDYVNRMRLPSNLSKSRALLEIVLATIFCVLTKIPLFIIGT